MSNPAAVRESQRLREEIRLLLLERSQAAPPLTSKHIQRQLSRHLDLRTIRWHVQSIRKEATPLPTRQATG